MKSIELFKIHHEEPNYAWVEQMHNARLILPKYTQQKYIVSKTTTEHKTKEEIGHRYLYLDLKHPRTCTNMNLNELSTFNIQ